MAIDMGQAKSKAKVLAHVILLAALGFYVALLWSYKNQIPDLTISVLSVTVMGGSLLLSAVITAIGGLIWFLLLRDYRVTADLLTASSIFAVAQFGKYLPGNVGQHIGRVVMAREINIPPSITLSTMLIELVWGMCVGAGLALLSLVLFVKAQSVGLNLNLEPSWLGLLVVFLLLTPWMGIGFLNRYLPQLANRLSGNGSIIAPRPRTALLVAALFLLGFLIMGLILKLQAQWFFGVADGSVFELTCLLAVAWLAGYVVPGAPGGLGMREAMMVLLLSPVLGVGASLGLSVTFRVTTIAGDAVAFLVGLIARRGQEKSRR